MASNNIASASVLLSTDNSPLLRGLVSARRSVASWGSSLSGGLAAAGRSAGMGLAAGIGLALGTAGLGSISSFVDGARDRFKELYKLGEYAKLQGSSVEATSGVFGLAKQGGSDFNSFVEAMVTAQKVVAEGMTGTGVVSQQFFKDLGHSAKEFDGLGGPDLFYKLVDSISSVGDGATKTRLAMIAFGEDEGKKLLPLIGKTEAQLREQAKAFELSTSDVAAASVAHESLTKATMSMNKAYDSLIIALVPVFSYIGDAAVPAVKSLTDSFNGFGSVTDKLESVVSVLAAMNDALLVGRGLWNSAQAAATGISGAFLRLSDNEAGKQVQEEARQMERAARERIQRGLDGTTQSQSEEAFKKFREDFERRKLDKEKSLTPPSTPAVKPSLPPAPKQPLAVVLEGSREAAAATAAFRNVGIQQDSIGKQQLGEAKKTNGLLSKIEQNIKGTRLEIV
jgi:hypothetical protein